MEKKDNVKGQAHKIVIFLNRYFAEIEAKRATEDDNVW